MAAAKPHVPSGKWQVFLGEEDLGILDEMEITLNDAFTLEVTAKVSVREMLAGVNELLAAPSRALVWFMRFKNGNPPHITTIDFRLSDLRLVELPADPTPARPARRGTGTSGSSPSTAT